MAKEQACLASLVHTGQVEQLHTSENVIEEVQETERCREQTTEEIRHIEEHTMRLLDERTKSGCNWIEEQVTKPLDRLAHSDGENKHFKIQGIVSETSEIRATAALILTS